MAINRYYTVDPQIGGLLEFLAGFGQQRNAVKSQEAATQTAIQGQSGQAISQGIASAGQSFGNAISQSALAKFNAQKNEAAALAQLAGQKQLDTFRTDNNLRQAQTAAFLEKYGTTPQAAFTQATSAVGPEAQTPPELQAFEQQSFVGPQPQMAGPPDPGATLPAQNPAMTQQYRKAKERLDQLNSVAAAIDLDNTRTPQERAQMLQTLMPHIAEAQQLLQRYPPPKQPTTWQELEASGGVIISPDFDVAATMGEGGIPKLTTLHRRAAQEDSAPWMTAGSTQEAEALKQQHFNLNHIGPVDPSAEYIWDGKAKRWEKQKAQEESELDVTFDDVLKTQKALTTKGLDSRGNAVENVPSLEVSTESAFKAKRLMAEQKKKAGFEAIISEFAPESISVEEYEAIALKLRKAYGEKQNVPGDLWSAFWELGKGLRAPARQGSFGE